MYIVVDDIIIIHHHLSFSFSIYSLHPAMISSKDFAKKFPTTTTTLDRSNATRSFNQYLSGEPISIYTCQVFSAYN